MDQGMVRVEVGGLRRMAVTQAVWATPQPLATSVEHDAVAMALQNSDARP